MARHGGDVGWAAGNRGHVGGSGHVGLFLAPEAGTSDAAWPAIHSAGQHLLRCIDGLG